MEGHVMAFRRFSFALPLLLAASLGACATNGVQPGVVSRSGSSSTYAQNQTYVPSQGYQNASMTGGPVAGTTPLDPNDLGNNANAPNGPSTPPPSAVTPSGNSGRVVSINDVSLRGGNGNGSPGNGTMVGGLLGGLGGVAIGATAGRSLGGAVLGGVLGAVGGAIAGSIYDKNQGGGGGYGGRGIEVTVQRDDGQTVTVAQRDDGDIQLGDRVQIVQGSNGVSQVVRDRSRNPD